MKEPRNPVTSLSTSKHGVAFRYRRGSVPGLTPIIFLHGLSQQGDFWQPVIESLGSGYSVLSIDLRGHGDSRKMEPDYRISRISEDCIEVLDELGLTGACIVGHSWGASVALHLAAENPERAISCVLIDGGAFTPANIIALGSVTRESLRIALTPPRGPFTRTELTGHFLPVGGDFTPTERKSIMAAINRTYVDASPGGVVTTIGVDRHMAVLEAFFDYNPDSDLDRLAVPTWILIASDQTAPVDTGEHVEHDDWKQVKRDVDAKVRGNLCIALQHWYGAVHDVPLYWPERVAQLISHAAAAQHNNRGVVRSDRI